MTLRKVHAKPKTYRQTFAKSATNTTALSMLANGPCIDYVKASNLTHCPHHGGLFVVYLKR
jgi:hypothetical protein